MRGHPSVGVLQYEHVKRGSSNCIQKSFWKAAQQGWRPTLKGSSPKASSLPQNVTSVFWIGWFHRLVLMRLNQLLP
jgi:hypothetical protein